MTNFNLIDELLAAEEAVDAEIDEESNEIVDELVDTSYFADVLHDAEEMLDNEGETLGNDYYNTNW
jgi:hypothetical protein